MTVDKDKALAMFKALGFKTATKWAIKRLTDKLNKLGEVMDADAVIEGDKDATETLTLVLEALADGKTITVGEQAEDAKPADKAKKGGKAKKDKTKTGAQKKADKAKVEAQKKKAAADKKKADKANAAKAKADAEAAKKAKADAKAEADKKKADDEAAKQARAAERKAKAEKAAADKAEREAKKVTGARVCNTRPYFCGQVIRKYGLAAGCTPEMVAEVDALYGKANPVETLFCLRNAWHAMRGFLNVNDDVKTNAFSAPAVTVQVIENATPAQQDKATAQAAGKKPHKPRTDAQKKKDAERARARRAAKKAEKK